MGQNKLQHITIDIGDLRVMFSGGNKLLEIITNEESYIHSHNNYELHYSLSGNYQLITDKLRIVTPGNITLIPPGVLHTVPEGTHKRLVLMISLLRGEKQRRSFSEYQYYSTVFAALNDAIFFKSEEIGAYLDTMMNLYVNEMSVHKLKIIFSMMFLRLAEHIVKSKEPSVNKLTASDIQSAADRRCLIENYISSNFATSGTIDGLCEHLNLCRRQTDRTVKRLFGESYQKLIIQKRMEVAEILIGRTNMPFTEISKRVGYDSYAGFYSAIKKFFCKTPEELRNKNT